LERAWELLGDCDPRDVCERSEARYLVAERSYILGVLGHPITVDMGTRTFRGSGTESEFLLTRIAYFSCLSILHYLLGAQRVSPTGRLVNPTDLKTAQIYFKGSHLLPLDQIAARFSGDTVGFLRNAARFGGEERAYGDAAAEIRAFPRVPVTLILWQEDDEFQARSYLLLDETCEQHLPPDILWSVAMMCTVAILKG
jgi:hypothetical protein